MRKPTGKKRDLLVLQIGNYFLEAAYFQASKETYELGFAEAVRISDKTDEDLETAIRSVKGWLTSDKAEVIVLIPRGQSIVKHFSVPSREEREIRKMIELSLPRELPYSAQDLAFDFLLTKPREPGYSEILFVGVTRESLGRWLGILDAVGLSASRVDWVTQGLVSRATQLGHLPKGQVSAIVHLDLEGSEIVTVEEGSIVFTRPLEGLGAREAGAIREEEIEKLVAEIHLNLLAARKEKGSPPNQVWIAGYVEADPRLKRAAEAKLSVPVGFVETYQKPFSLMSHWGVSQMAMPRKVELLPFELREQKIQAEAASERNRLFIRVFVLGAVIVGLTFLNIQKDEFLARRLETKIAKVNAEAKKLQGIVRDLNSVAQFQEEKAVLLEFLTFLHEKAPDGIQLGVLSWDTSRVSLRGMAETNERLTELLSQLRGFAGLERVQLGFSQRKVEGGKEQFEFEILGERRL